MNDKARNPAGVDATNHVARQSFDTMSQAFSNWMRNANRVQAETIRFMNERFTKDLQAFSRVGACRKPEDFVGLQSELLTQLVADYMEEGARMMKLFGNMADPAAKR